MFVADEQTQGRGRGENVWTSPLGCLMFSFKCTQTVGAKLPFLQYLVSLALIKAIKSTPHTQVERSSTPQPDALCLQLCWMWE